MNFAYDCIPCTVQSFLRLIQSNGFPERLQETVLRKVLTFLSEADYSLSPPALARDLHRMLRQILDNPDPYAAIKKKTNGFMLARYAELKKRVENSQDPFQTALRLAVAGNVIDFAAKHLMDVDETINHSRIRFAVRGGPVINDATVDDALEVGLDRLAEVIHTGDDAPGVIWETSSDEFKAHYRKADVIIAKGQGNLEGLSERPEPIFFLFVTKCERVAEMAGVPVGSFMVWRKGAG
ncbi:MAG TPA: DUF89 family protein [bacterium]|nr:DUF89 family protein [bacterium]